MLWLMLLWSFGQQLVPNNAPIIDRTLDNGVRVIAVVRPDAPYAVVGLWLKVGSADDEIGKEGTAHLLEHLVPLRRWDDTTVQIAIERMGGMLIAETGRDFMAFQIAAPAKALPKVLPLLVQGFCEPPTDEPTMEREKELMRLEMMANFEDPFWVMKTALEAQLFDGTAYVHPPGGWMETIASLKAEDVRQFHRKHFVAPNVAVIAVVPDAEMLMGLEQSLGQLPQKQFFMKREPTPVRIAPEITISLRGKEALWGLGWRVDIASDEAIALDTLTLHLRTTVAQSVFGRFEAVQEWSVVVNPIRNGAAISFIARLRPFTDAPERLLRQAVRQLAETPLTEEATARLKQQLLLSYRWQIATPLELAKRVGWAWALYNEPSLPMRYEQGVEALTPLQLQTLARRLNETPPVTFVARSSRL